MKMTRYKAIIQVFYLLVLINAYEQKIVVENFCQMFEHVSEVLTYAFKRNLSDCSKTPIERSPLSFLQVLDTYVKILNEAIEIAKSSLKTMHVVAVGVIEKTNVTDLVKALKSSKYQVEL